MFPIQPRSSSLGCRGGCGGKGEAPLLTLSADKAPSSTQSSGEDSGDLPMRMSASRKATTAHSISWRIPDRISICTIREFPIHRRQSSETHGETAQLRISWTEVCALCVDAILIKAGHELFFASTVESISLAKVSHGAVHMLPVGGPTALHAACSHRHASFWPNDSLCPGARWLAGMRLVVRAALQQPRESPALPPCQLSRRPLLEDLPCAQHDDDVRLDRARQAVRHLRGPGQSVRRSVQSGPPTHTPPPLTCMTVQPSNALRAFACTFISVSGSSEA